MASFLDVIGTSADRRPGLQRKRFDVGLVLAITVCAGLVSSQAGPSYGLTQRIEHICREFGVDLDRVFVFTPWFAQGPLDPSRTAPETINLMLLGETSAPLEWTRVGASAGCEGFRGPVAVKLSTDK